MFAAILIPACSGASASVEGPQEDAQPVGDHGIGAPDAGSDALAIDDGPSRIEPGDASGDAAPSPCSAIDLGPKDLGTGADAGPGVDVRQLSSIGSNVSAYFEVPGYSAAAQRVILNGLTGKPMSHKNVLVAKPDGTGAIDLGVAIGGGLEGGVNLTWDGALAYFAADNGDGTLDLYGVPLGDGSCARKRISTLALRPTTDDAVKISTASWDAATKQYVFAIAVDAGIHRVRGDGTELPKVPLPDPDNTDPFHRPQLNPVCPNILMYRRDAGNDGGAPDSGAGPRGGLPQIWVVDLANDPSHVHAVSTANNAHQLWSPDGRQVGYAATDGASFAIADVVTSACTLAAETPAGFKTTRIAPASGDAVLFCTWGPGGGSLLCNNDCRSRDVVFAMAMDGKTTTLLFTGRDCKANDYWGQADAQFMGDAQHVLFSSDRSGTPQAYLATLPPGLVP